jgi:hypothetical protein
MADDWSCAAVCCASGFLLGVRHLRMRRKAGDQPFMYALKEPREAAQFIFEVTVSSLKSGTDADSCTSLVANADPRDALFDGPAPTTAFGFGADDGFNPQPAGSHSWMPH